MRILKIQYNKNNILKPFTKGFDLYNNILKQGKILSIKNGVSKVSGLLGVQAGEMVQLGLTKWVSRSFLIMNLRLFSTGIEPENTLQKFKPDRLEKRINSFEILDLEKLGRIIQVLEKNKNNENKGEFDAIINKIFALIYSKNLKTDLVEKFYRSGIKYNSVFTNVYLPKSYGYSKEHLAIPGRIYPEDSISCVYLPKQIRNVIFKDIYYHFDILNLHAGILCYYSSECKLPNESLLYYFNNLEKICKNKHYISYDKFKLFFLSVLNGGLDLDLDFLKINDTEVFNLVKKIQREVNIIQLFVSQYMLNKTSIDFTNKRDSDIQLQKKIVWVRWY